MIVFNNKKYALNDDEFTNSLFTPGGTCNGFYKRTKNGFRLFNMQKELIAFVRLTFEPMLIGAKKQADNKLRYSYLNAASELYLGFNKYESLQQYMAIHALKELHFN